MLTQNLYSTSKFSIIVKTAGGQACQFSLLRFFLLPFGRRFFVFMKKILAVFFASFVLIISIPCSLTASASVLGSVDINYYTSQYPDLYSDHTNYLLFHYDLTRNLYGPEHWDGTCVIFFNDNVEFYLEDNFIKSSNIEGNYNLIYTQYEFSYSGSDITPFDHANLHTGFTSFEYDLENNHLIFSNGLQLYSFERLVADGWTFQGRDLDSNIEALTPHVDIDITFDPVLNGEVSRKKTINGKSYTSDFLFCSVTNNGRQAQIAYFIVPHGEDMSFPDSLISDNKGYIGNPTFAYVRDEWTKFTVGFIGSSVYAPSVWHVIPQGYINQPFDVPWSSFNLAKDTEYDVVFYATFNDDSEHLVQTDLSEVEEIYRSSFTISDPLEFNPNNEAFDVHPFDGNVDNSDLFNYSEAFKDDNGNIVVREQGFKPSSFSSGSVSSTPVNVNSTFGNFFNFFNNIMQSFPSQYLVLISLGLSAIIIVAIIKAVTS